MSDDPYVYPGTDVLRNARGIRDAGELQIVEANLTYMRTLQLASHPIPGKYDLAHFQAFHRYLFGELYDWAGQLRTVVLARTDLFCLPEHIKSYAAEIFGRLADEQQLSSLNRDAFVERATHYLGDVNALHPFRDGNGRAQRAFFTQLAADAGFRLDWQLVKPQQNVDAFVATTHGDETPLRRLLDTITTSTP